MNPKERCTNILQRSQDQAQMKLGDAGEAFFVEEAEDLDEAYATSPIVSPFPSPTRNEQCRHCPLFI